MIVGAAVAEVVQKMLPGAYGREIKQQHDVEECVFKALVTWLEICGPKVLYFF
jgi:hypothetical protein